jgi:O-antigen/teichoic acid export membrane protein
VRSVVTATNGEPGRAGGQQGSPRGQRLPADPGSDAVGTQQFRGIGRPPEWQSRAATHSRRGRRKPVPPAARRLGRVLRWILVNTASARSGTLVIVLILARTVAPAELGEFGVCILALLAVRSITGLGISKAIADWQSDLSEIVPTASTISVASSVVMYAGCYYVAPAYAAVMGTPAATHVIRILALNVLIGGLVAAPRGMLQRQAPGRRVLVDQVDNWLGVIATLGLFAHGYGLMSLAIGRTGGSIVAAALFAVLQPQAMRFGLSPRATPRLLRAALPAAASSLVIFAIMNSDQAVVGHLLGMRTLGFYLLALCCASWPVTVFSQPVRDMTPAAFARFRVGPQVAGSASTSSVSLLACLTWPACMLIACAAGPLIQVIYGPAWATAAHLLIWLAPVAALRVFYELANDYLTAFASFNRALLFQLGWAAAQIPCLIAGYRADGVVGVAAAQLAVAAVMLVAWYVAELAPGAARPGLPTVRLGAPFIAAAAVAVITLGARRLIKNDVVDLLIGTAATLAAMGLVVYRMRTVLGAVRHGAASVAARPWPTADAAFGPALGSVFEPSLYPVLSAAPAAAVARELVETEGAAGSDLGARVRAGVRWSAMNTIVLRVSNFAVGIVLARTVFGPSIWGLYAVSQVILAVLLSANELGVSAAIIRWEGDVRHVARTVLTLSVASSLVLFGVLYATAPTISRLLGSPGATDVVRVVCACVILDGFAGVPLALITKEFAQGRRMIVDSVNFVTSTAITLWLAFSGHGAISFSWGALAGCTVGLVFANVLAPYVVLPGWDLGDARRLLRYGLPLAGASLLVMLVFNVDSAIVGATLGAAMLGIYQLAFNISSWPVVGISQAVSRVSFAGFSRLADTPEKLADAFTRSLAMLMALTVPACVLLATVAKPLILVVYGQRWIDAAPVLSLLAMLGMLRVAYGLVYDCLAAAGRRHMLMWVQAMWLATLIPVLLVGAKTHGLIGVGAGHLIVAGGLVGPAFLIALSRVGISVRSIVNACWLPCAGGILMAVVALLVLHAVGDGPAGLAAAVGAGTAAYAPFVLPIRSRLRRPQLRPSVELNEPSAA